MSATQTSDLTLITSERQLSGALLYDLESTIDSFVTMRPRRITLKLTLTNPYNPIHFAGYRKLYWALDYCLLIQMLLTSKN